MENQGQRLGLQEKDGFVRHIGFGEQDGEDTFFAKMDAPNRSIRKTPNGMPTSTRETSNGMPATWINSSIEKQVAKLLSNFKEDVESLEITLNGQFIGLTMQMSTLQTSNFILEMQVNSMYTQVNSL